MALTSFRFFFFFIVTLVVYYAIPLKTRWMALLAFSAAFFLASSPPYTIAYLAVSVASTTLCARRIGKCREEKKGAARAALLIGILVNAGMLVLLKYNYFVTANGNLALSILHIPLKIPSIEFEAPIGMSFYTFSVLGYLLDVYWGIAEAQGNALKTALFIGYYPQLTSGPITRYGEVGGALFEGHGFDAEAVMMGIWRMLWGTFKKLVISERLGVIVDTIYGDVQKYSGLYIWLAAALFMLQLYTDFSGCMDIVLGASECYGIALPENFKTPFLSRSVQEFWQRWHITLGGWMRDYVLYPVMRSRLWKRMAKWIRKHFGKKAASQIPSLLGMLCVWLLMGLWHGGKWKFILGEGVWFWLCIGSAQVLEPAFKKAVKFLKINTECFSYRLFQSLRVFVLVSIGNMFFRMPGFREALQAMRAGLRWNQQIFASGSLLSLGLDGRQFGVMVFGLLLLAAVSYLQEKKGSARKWLAEQNIVFQWIVLVTLSFLVFVIGMYGTYSEQDFMYQQF